MSSSQIHALERGTIQLEIQQGQLVSIGCFGHRFFYAPEELKEPAA